MFILSTLLEMATSAVPPKCPLRGDHVETFDAGTWPVTSIRYDRCAMLPNVAPDRNVEVTTMVDRFWIHCGLEARLKAGRQGAKAEHQVLSQRDGWTSSIPIGVR